MGCPRCGSTETPSIEQTATGEEYAVCGECGDGVLIRYIPKADGYW